MRTGRYSIKELLTHNEIEQIIIPEIQRDYVWKSKNVTQLLNSIINHFQNKKREQISFKVNGQQIEEGSITNYLQKEYSRLLYNTKIGFVYAYHDNEYAGKFFLIDGQQRFTTLYLLLLAVYVKSGKTADFKTLYFTDNLLKIDYKVRENSHNFMRSFISNELSENPTDIKLSNQYYKNEYEEDETIVNLISNYNTIKTILEKNEAIVKENNSLDNFLEYIEEYIEVNYFDTNISEQGEQLYLYMNSRGEFLSHQEIVKSEIIKKEKTLDDKKQVGKQWEEWQNYFWTYRGNNENADIGFEEFLKWWAILHICTTNSEEHLVFEEVKGKRQSLREAKENYINKTKAKVERQRELLAAYQVKQLNATYLKNAFSALESLLNLNFATNPLDKKLLSEMGGAVNYINILPLIYFINNSSCINQQEQDIATKRLIMFLYGTTSFLSISKNPDNATIDAIELVKSLCDSGKTDIVCFLDEGYDNKFKSYLTSYTRQVLSLYEKAGIYRQNLEEVIWAITVNTKLTNFLKGDFSILFKTVKLFYSKQNRELIIDNTYCEELKAFYGTLTSLLEEYNVYNNGKDSDIFRRALLTFGDYSVKTNGSYRLGNRIEGYSFGYSDNSDNKEMTEIFNNDKEYLPQLLVNLKENKTNDLKFIIEDYKKTKAKDWREAFIENKSILNYCNKKRILRESPQRVVLISEKDKGYKELQCKLLESLFKDRKMWVFQHNVCVLDFDLVNDKIEHKEKSYAIDIKYENTEWHYSILYREDSEREEKLKIFTVNNFGNLNDEFRVIPQKSIIYKDVLSLSIVENVNNVKIKLDKLLIEIELILKKQLLNA
ncbi:GmrSD restriction endonuclease domain-containing protein [Aequorivita aquimaris]|uniref:GmrSD restriction endonuclease domain-containing protein n=1 Tax=Aequorivita aquimaris TaxID=1548749 RepID=UPI0007868C71|nr:DUF262 domain-containing protein [Aequorivita aquimaris]